VAAGGDEGNERWLKGRVGEVGSGDMTFEVVYRGKREFMGISEAFGGRNPNEESPDQTRTYRHGYTGYLVQGYVRVGECLLYDAVKTFQVGAGGDLGDDATVTFVLRLGMNYVGEGAASLLVEDSRAGVVAGGFDS
jgi:hypothetical protein